MCVIRSLRVRSAKRRHQSPEWTILSHVNCFVRGEVHWFQVLLVSLHPHSMGASWWSPPVVQRGNCYYYCVCCLVILLNDWMILSRVWNDLSGSSAGNALVFCCLWITHRTDIHAAGFLDRFSTIEVMCFMCVLCYNVVGWLNDWMILSRMWNDVSWSGRQTHSSWWSWSTNG